MDETVLLIERRESLTGRMDAGVPRTTRGSNRGFEKCAKPLFLSTSRAGKLVVVVAEQLPRDSPLL